MIHNREIADQLGQLADLLEIQGANPFRVRAYRTAARTIGSLPRDVEEMLAGGEDLSELPGIGDDLAEQIREAVKSGRLKRLEQAERETSPELSELMKLPGLGAKRVGKIHDELGVTSPTELHDAAEDHELRELEGFGAKMEEKILRELERREGEEQRTKLSDVDQVANSLTRYLREVDGVKKVVVAGSFRRRRETVGDLDVLVTCKQQSPVMEAFVDYDEVQEVVSHGKTKSTVRLRSGLQVDLRVVAEVSYGAALYYFTGSKEHSIATRRIARKKELKINEYGVFRGDDRVAGKTEEEVFEQIDLPWIPPELRENRGEIEAAKEGKLPELIELDNLRGNLHTHTNATDGKFSLREMAEAARDRGLEYLAITDHSKAVTMVGGLDEKALRKQIREIEKVQRDFDEFKILTGIEVDILEDGSLDLDESVLKELDVVVASIHRKLDLPAKEQTERILRAMDHPCVHIIGHPTGRLINQRRPMELDIERIVQGASQRGCCLELNAQPDRLDLKDVHCKLAKEKGVKIAISADAHAKTDLQFLRFGIDQARRGWLEANDVVNTHPWSELRSLLKRD